MNDLEKKAEIGGEEVHIQIMKIVSKEYFFRVRIDGYNVQNPEKTMTVSSISNVSAPPTRRMRPAPLCASQLSGYTSTFERTLKCIRLHSYYLEQTIASNRLRKARRSRQ